MSDLIIPELVLTQHAAVLGKTGKGKSSVLRYIVEYLLKRKKRVCIIDPKGDWWGLKSSADGKGAGLPVINDKATDVQINAHSGAEVAKLIAGGNRPCVIGLRGWMPGEMSKFWLDFAPTLYNSNAGELFFIGDEFHNFAPKNVAQDVEKNKCLHWANRLLSEGRGTGMVCFIASQRPQKVHNDTLTCCETLFALGVTHTSDRKAIQLWLDGCGDKVKSNIVLSSLASLQKGEAYVWSPEIGFGPERMSFPMFKTFDSFAPPQLQAKVNQSGWAGVDLTEVKQRLAQVIEESKANDPKELKLQIARLQKELKLAQKPTQPVVATVKTEIKEIEVPAINKGDFARLEKIANGIAGFSEKVSQILLVVSKPMRVISTDPWIHSTLKDRKKIAVENIPPRPLPPATLQPVEKYIGEENPTPTGGLKRILIALAQNQSGLTSKKIGVRAGLSSKSGTFSTYLATMRRNGWVQGSSSLLQITEQGITAIGDYQPLPTGDALLNYWLNFLGGSGAARMLRALAEAYPDAMARQDLANVAQISPDSGTFSTYLAKLRSLDLVTASGELKASEYLFES